MLFRMVILNCASLAVNGNIIIIKKTLVVHCWGCAISLLYAWHLVFRSTVEPQLSKPFCSQAMIKCLDK